MPMRVIRAELYSRLQSTKHDRLSALQGIAAGHHVVSSLFIQKLLYARISEKFHFIEAVSYNFQQSELHTDCRRTAQLIGSGPQTA